MGTINFTWLFFLPLLSCSNEIDNNQISLIGTKKSTKSFTVEELNFLNSTRPIADEPITVLGYTNATIREGLSNAIINVTEENKNIFQLDPGRYVVDYYRVTKNVTLPSGAYGLKQFSPDCGYDPFEGNGVKGYSPIQTGNTYLMQTNTTHFKSKNGTNLSEDTWRPHMPQFMKWVYACRYNPNLINRVEAIKSDKHVAFTTIAGSSNKSKILIAYREGSSHVSYDGKIFQLTSYDYGKTWKDKKVIYEPNLNVDVRDPQFLVLSDNTLICRFFERTPNKCIVKCMRSYDFGNTYQNPTILAGSSSSNWTGSAAAKGNMLLLNGTIYSVSYDSVGAWLTKSIDSGNSWSYVSELRSGINETSLGYENGKIFCIARQIKEGASMYGESNDMGKTWSWQNINVSGDAPSLTPYNNGYILTYRNKGNALSSGYSIDLAFWKNGQIVSTPVTLYNNNSMDIGYADVLTMNSSFLVSCYIPNTIRCYEFWYDILQ